ncbi:hypothetical protein [Subtercola sp. RTI3]|uniref:hypothetical protein n=1 Tax=Subtercola sp. RTI3 TaxID=3048639 RepID=UPI002B22732F|nr:hypothetical protein [Subtercola sp. RTI3]MEA9984577.1 hypothetical protein [Subtercola sp. RTI3]
MSTDDRSASDAASTAGEHPTHPAASEPSASEPSAFPDADAPRYDPASTASTPAGTELAAPGEPAVPESNAESHAESTEAAPVAPAESTEAAPAAPTDGREAEAPRSHAPMADAPVAGASMADAPVAGASMADAPMADAPIAEPLAPASEVFEVPSAPAVAPRWATPAPEEHAVAYPAEAYVRPPANPYPAAGAAAAAAVATGTAGAAGAGATGAGAIGAAVNGAGSPPIAPAPVSPAAYAQPQPTEALGSPGAPVPPGSAGAQPQASYLPPGYVAPTTVMTPVLTPPKKRSNRAAGTLIALIGALVFAIVYALVGAVILAFTVTTTRLPEVMSQFVSSPAFFVPVIFFAIALILVVLIVNRANWWAYVLGGFLVAVVVYGAAILGALLAVQAWTFSADQAAAFVRSLVMDPLTLAAAIVAREVPIWVGAWISSRGRKLKARNAADREEYDRAVADAAEQQAQASAVYANGQYTA